MKEIESNDFNLNISRYVDTREPVRVVSVEIAQSELAEAEKKHDEAGVRMDGLLPECGSKR